MLENVLSLVQLAREDSVLRSSYTEDARAEDALAAGGTPGETAIYRRAPVALIFLNRYPIA